ncbi:MAG: flippase-like domain-containing protein [Deltaproteobacteria bacterium]|nr:flippase-like domain-containing protein [Deltaproteobacteria bacterium]
MKSKKTMHRILLHLLLSGLGLALFAYLVISSGVNWKQLRELDLAPLGFYFVSSSLVIVFDTIGWYYAVRHLAIPPWGPLFALRVAGDALTNGIPGGVVLGEAYRAVMLRERCGLSLADNAATLLLIKLGLGLSQAMFVTIGVGLCFPQLQARSTELLGYPGAGFVALGATVLMALLLVVLFRLLLRGTAFSSMARALTRLPLPAIGNWFDRRRASFERFDDGCRQAVNGNSANLIWTFFWLFVGWLATALESYLLLAALGLSAAGWRQAYVIEAVGSIFRLVFFMVPSGIGGQDATLVALFRLYDLPREQSGAYIMIKRLKELVWIGAGLLLIPLLGRRSRRRAEHAPGEPLRESGE